MGLNPAKDKSFSDMVQSRFFSTVTVILAISIIGFFLVRQVSEYDIWYHMAMGQEILRHGKLPTTDQITLLNYGQPLQAHLWLFQTIAARGFRTFGFYWLQAMQITIWGAALFCTYRSTRHWSSAGAAWLILTITAIACEERFSIRPEIVSYAFIAAFYWKLQQGRYRTRAEISLLVALQWIWTNSHGLFAIGPFIVGCYLAAAFVKGKPGRDYTDVRPLGILFAGVAAACIITPNGFENIRYTMLLITETSPNSHAFFKNIYELAHPLGSVSRTLIAFWFFFTLFSAFLITTAAMIATCREKLPLARLFIVLAMLATSMSGIRNMPLFALVAAPIVAEHLYLLKKPHLRRACIATVAATLFIAAMVWSPRTALNHLTTWVPYRFGLGGSADYVPLELHRFLNRIGFTGPTFNTQTLGGIYAYYGAPGRIPFYDGRFESYAPKVLNDIYETSRLASENPARWLDLMQAYDFRGLLLGNKNESTGPLSLTAKDLNWRLVYLDYAASFWIRADQENLPPPVQREQVSALVKQVASSAQAENLDFFLEKTRYYPELRLQLLEDAVGQWEDSTLLINLGLLKFQSGNFVESEQLFRRVLKLKPDSRLTLTTLAQLALYRGDQTAAEKYIRKALSYSPNDAELLQNLNSILISR